MNITDPLRVVTSVINILDGLSIDYILGGSLASSIHGIPRASQDADLVVTLNPPDIESLIEKLKADFYVDPGAVRNAVERKKSFNIIHLATMFKVDLFVREPAGPTEELFSRRRLEEIIEGKPVYVYSPEDIILEKLDWYRKGGRVSDRQWQDIIGVIKVQGPRLDLPYLNLRAEQRGLHQLLRQALGQAKLRPLSGDEPG